jgi:hypothetical protein
VRERDSDRFGSVTRCGGYGLAALRDFGRGICLKDPTFLDAAVAVVDVLSSRHRGSKKKRLHGRVHGCAVLSLAQAMEAGREGLGLGCGALRSGKEG